MQKKPTRASHSEERRFIIKKYVIAKSIEEAILKEASCAVDSAYIDEDWSKEEPRFGFVV